MKKTVTTLLFLSATFALVGCVNNASTSSTAALDSNSNSVSSSEESASVSEESASSASNSTDEATPSSVRTTWTDTEIQTFVSSFGSDYSTSFPCFVPEGGALVTTYFEDYGCLTVEAPNATEEQVAAGTAALTAANFVLTEDTDSNGDTYTTYRIVKDNLNFDADIYIDGTTFSYDIYVTDNGASASSSTSE